MTVDKDKCIEQSTKQATNFWHKWNPIENGARVSEPRHETETQDMSTGIRTPRFNTMALFHCMVRHGTVRYGSLLGGFPLGTVPGTWYFFSTTSAEVPSDPYRYQNVTCKLCWSLIGRRESSLLHHWTCEMRPIDPLDLNQHSQRRNGRSFCLNKRTFLYQPQNSSVVVCWGSIDVPLFDSEERIQWELDGVTPKEKALCITLLLNLLYFQSMFSVYIFTSVSVFCFN